MKFYIVIAVGMALMWWLGYWAGYIDVQGALPIKFVNEKPITPRVHVH